MVYLKQKTMKSSQKNLLLLICLFISFLSFTCGASSVFAASFAEAQEAAKRISAGLNHSLAVNFDGTVVVWGENTGAGQANAVPVGLSDVKAVSAGYYHNLALKTDGTVVAWGLDNDGQCTVPDTAKSGIKAIAAGGYHSIALNEDGKVIAWGNNASGQCTVPLEAQSGVIAIAAGGYHCLALKADGTVVAWGNNDHGQCNDLGRNLPAELTNVMAITAGDAHSLALKKDGTVAAWGANGAWQCEVPTDLRNVVAIAAGNDFSLALTSDTIKVTVWGNLSEPSSNRDIGAITAGGFHTLAVNYYLDVIKAWGNNEFSQCTVPQEVNLNGNLADCAVEDVELTFSSNVKGCLGYIGEVDNSVESINVTITLENVNQAVYIYKDGASGTTRYPASGASVQMPLSVGVNNFIIRIYLPFIGQNIYHQYVLQVHRAAADVDLKTLKTNVGTRTEAFVPEVTNYTINVDKDEASMDITVITNNPEASVSIGGNAPEVETQTATVPLVNGENTVDIIVAKGEENKTYTLQIIKAGFLENLIINEGQLSSAFEPETLNYMVDVNSTITSLEITPTLRDTAHELLINGTPHINGESKTITLSEEKHQAIKLDVKLPDTAIIRTYTLNINRVTKDDFIGSGTLEDPYLIYNLHALQEIAYDNTLLDKYFQLVCDLDATNTINWNNGAGFFPIGSPTNKFTGCFEGAGHTITGLFINQPVMDYVGLFGCIEEGEIRNLGLANCEVKGNNKVGALFGESYNTYFENCYSTGTVSGTSAVGGLGGSSSGDYLTEYHLANCYSRASVNGTTATGGLIGELNSGWLNYCYAAGFVQGTGGLVGALADAENCHETNCYWDLDTSGKASSFLGSGKISIAMKEQTTYHDWDFTSTWAIDAETNEGYPYLQVFKDTLSPVVDSSLILWLDGRHGSNDAMISIWNDLSGRGNHGELRNVNFTENSGWTGEFLRLDGVDDQINIPKLNYDQDFTLNMLFSLNNFVAWSDLVTDNYFRIFHRGWYDELFFLLRIKDQVKAADSAWNYTTGYSNNYIPLKTIVNFSFIKKGNIMSIYRNGILARSKNVVSGLNNGNDLILNTEIKSLLKINGNSMSSDLYNIRFYNRALTAAEVEQNYHAEQPRIKAMTAANLAELTVTPGVMSPAFKASTLNYTVLLEDRAVESVNITATPLGADATVTIDGQGLGTGTQSINIDVSSGTKEVPVVVTEADGITTKTYKIRIVKPGYLTNLSIDGTSVTGFASETLDYTVDVANSVTAVNIAATLEDPSTQGLMINNQPCTSGNSMQIPLNVGMNTIPIQVTVPGSVTTYTLNIKRAATADLQALTIEPGTLVPDFDPAATSYTVALDEPLDNIEITCTPVDLGATVTINGKGDGAGVQSATVALTYGTNTINIVVTSVDKLFKKTYTVNVIRPAYLTALTVKNNAGQPLALAPAFTATTFDYTLPTVENNVTFLDITVIGENGASVLINDIIPTENTVRIPLEVGPNPIIIKVAPNTKPDLINTYTITVHRKSSANLSNILTSAGTLLPSFNADTTDYTITLDNPLDSIDLTATPTDSKASVTMLQPVIDDSLVLWLDGRYGINNPATMTWKDLSGKGNDGQLQNFTFTEGSGWTGNGLQFDGVDDYVEFGDVLKLGINNATWSFWAYPKDVAESGYVFSKSYAGPETGRYFCCFRNNKARMAFAWALGHIEYFSNSNVTANTWIHVVVTLDRHSNLCIYLNGVLDAVFNVSKYSEVDMTTTLPYRVGGYTAVDKVTPSMFFNGTINNFYMYNRALSDAEVAQNYQAGQEWLTQTGTRTINIPLKAGKNPVALMVQGTDGVTTKTYNVEVNRPASLTDLTINKGTLTPNFDPDIQAYTATVDDRTTSLNIAASVEEGAELYINGDLQTSGEEKEIALEVGTNEITINTVIAGLTRTYTLTVTRTASDVSLSGLSANIGEWNDAFTPETTAYTVTLDTLAESIEITATPADSGATVKINGNGTGIGEQKTIVAITAGENIIPINITGWDGVTTGVYTLTVVRPGCLTDLTVSDGAGNKQELLPVFDSETLSYTVNVPNNITEVDLKATLENEVTQQLSINGAVVPSGTPKIMALAIGPNPITIEVIMPGITRTYTLTVNRAMSASVNTDLWQLTTNVGEVLPLFDPVNTAYTMSVAHTIDNLTITAVPFDIDATVLIMGEGIGTGAQSVNISLEAGDNLIPIIVRARDESTTKTYTLKIIRGLSSNANLQTLTVTQGSLTPNFDHNTATYKVETGVEINEIAITATTTDSSATFTVNEQAAQNNVPLTINLDHGGNLIPIVITASDEITQKAYIVSVNGKVSNADLGSLTVKAVNASDPENPQMLDLDFNSDKTYYQLSVDRTITSLELTASLADSKALILLNENILPTGKACQIALAEGENIIQLMVVAQDASTKNYTLEVFQNRFLAIATNSLPIGILGTPYTCKLTANGGSTPYIWSATGLPTGLTLNPSTGEITGTPKSEGVYEIAITVTDQQGNHVTKNLPLRLNLGCGTSGYLLTPIKDPVYTIGYDGEGFPLLTVKKGFAGFCFFAVNITPVQGHPAKERVSFTHLRNGKEVQTNSLTADFDNLAHAQTGFNVCAGDVIKIRITNA